MTIRVEYWAQLKQAAGVAAEDVDVPAGITLADVAASLVARHDGSFRDLLLDGAGKPRASNMVMVNQQMARWDERRVLKAGDLVTILSPISGG